jgi:hypothetical protein
MSCYTGLTADITNSCTDVVAGGVEERMWAINRADILSVTYDSTNSYLATAITLKTGGKKAYKITGTKNSNNPGYSLVIGENTEDTYQHTCPLIVSKKDADTVKALAELGDVVLIAETIAKESDGDGTFRVYGITYGLHKSEETQTSNDNKGQVSLTLQSREGRQEPKPPIVLLDTDYDTTLEALVALETETAS